MSQTLTLARPYARAAFAIARDGGRFAQWSDALGFAARIAADSQVASLLANPRLTAGDAITLLSVDGTEPAFADFLALLAENRRMTLLPEIAGLYEQLRADAEKVVRAKVTSATTLPVGELDTITAALRKRFGREVHVETAIDESLIGGALIDTGDMVIDGSLRGKLQRLQAALNQ
ncbi:F0F1 ATP synthase subunit delta [Lysobacter sp. M15]|uniref:F0F1 ATP synthase subunit delta n=1 Tax=Lysobacter sp. M15 TaxID=2916837 RepID=UPI001F587713